MRPLELVRGQGSVWLVWLLVLIAHLATEIVISDDHPQVLAVVSKVLVVLVVTAVIMHRALRDRWQAGAHTVLFALVGLIGPQVVAPVWEAVCGRGHAFEIQLIVGLRNFALITVIWAWQARMARIAGVASLFTLMFCVSTSQDRSLQVLIGLYLLVGLVWLCVSYWATLKTEKVRGQETGIPWFLWGTLGLGVIVSLMLFVLPEESRTRMVEGFMPSSGGTGAYDRRARSGVGDGDALVAGTTQAMSFAPLEDAPFIEGNEPSLYDVFQETYGPVQPPKKMDRAISLPPELFNANHHHMAQAKKSGKTFSLRRQPPQQTGHRHLNDTESSAILHLVGRVPVHLRHTVYDLFDGQEWYPRDFRSSHERKLEVEYVDEKPWITWLENRSLDVFAGLEPHALRILNVETNRILSPSNLVGVHIDLCDRPDLFRWEQDDILAMDREQLPGMTVIQLRSQLIDPARVRQRTVYTRSGDVAYNSLPEGAGMERVQQLALEWTRGCTSGWQKAESICRKLREEYVVDDRAAVPEAHASPVEWFLFEGKRGPDVQFATAATLLLRASGVSARVVSGFYADPAQYDPVARQTSVYPGDVHWWPEVFLTSGVWAPFEPTPGYEVLTPPQSWLARAWNGLVWMSHQTLRYWPVSLLLVGLTAAGLRYRRAILAQWLLWRWVWRYGRNWQPERLRDGVREAIATYDRQLELTQSPRPVNQTFSRYLQTSSGQEQTGLSATAAEEFSRCSDWALYAQQRQACPSADAEQIRLWCLQLVKQPNRSRQTVGEHQMNRKVITP